MKKAEIKKKFKELTATRAFKKACGITLCVLAFLLVFRLFLLVFPVKTFEIEGSTHYSINDIINASDIKTGSPLYGINVSKVKKKIKSECPYVTEVKIKRKFPGTVCFVIEEGEPGWYIQVGDSFYALDYDLNVLLEAGSDEDMKRRGLTKLVLPELQSVIVGEVPSFGYGDELLISETLKVIDTIRNNSIKSRMTSLDLTNRFEIKFTIDETFDVNLGDIKNSDTKFTMIKTMVDNSKEEGYAGGEIYPTYISPLDFTIDGYFPEPEEEQDEDLLDE